VQGRSERKLGIEFCVAKEKLTSDNRSIRNTECREVALCAGSIMKQPMSAQ